MQSITAPLNQTSGEQDALMTQQRSEASLTAIDMDVLTSEIRGENGRESKDRFYRLRLWERSFLGCKAVDWLIRTQGISEQGAVDIGPVMLMDRGVIRYVADEQLFQDGYFLYQFYDDERDGTKRS